MASAYSTPKQFENYVQPVNLELVNFVLGSKEQKFNYNVAKVEQTLQDFGELGLVRGQDKEYLADRVNTMLTQMGDIENMDWSDSNIERQITSGIREAIDDKVRKDIKMSRSYTNYLQQVQKVKEEEPEKYSDINFAMGLKMAGADKWARGEADEFGNLQYTPYTDVKGEQNEFIQDYIKTHGDESIEEYDGELNGVKIQRKIKGLSREQVESIWEANMTPNQRRQLQMEATYYSEQLPTSERPEVVKRYKNNLRQEIKVHKNTVDALKAEMSNKGVSSEKKAQLEAQIEKIEGNISTISGTINKNIDYQTAYMDSYYKMNKDAVVDANSFRRVTDIERDKTLLDAMKTNAQIAKMGREASEVDSKQSGSNLTVAPSGGINTEDSDLDVYTTQVRTQLGDSITGLVNSVGQATKDESIDFKTTFGIDAHEFNKKTREEKEAFVTAKFKGIEEGIDLKSEGGYTPEVIDAYYNYKSSREAFQSVNEGIQSAEETIAKKTFDGMVAGYKGGDFEVGNFKNEVIKSIVKNSGDNDVSFESLSPDERKAFRVAMIDESIRGYDVDQEEIMPYLLTNRQELLNEIKDENLRNQFVSNEMIGSEDLDRVVGGVTNIVKGLWNMTFGDKATGAVNLSEANRYREEIQRRRSPLDFFKTDEDLDSLNTRATGERDLGEDAEMDASTMIQNEYKAAVEVARQKAGEAAVKMPSTYVISLNPRVKTEENLSRKAQQRIAIDKGYGTDDLANNAVQVHYNKADNSVQFSTVLRSSSQERYGLEGSRVMSNPVPIEQLNDMPEIKNRIQRDDAPWALDSKNPNAAPVKFKTSGFNDATEQQNAIKKLAPYLDTERAMQLKNAPHSIGYTKSKIKSMFGERTRQTDSGEQRSFIEEFPNTFQALAQGAGEFEINYESAHNEGYYASVDYVVGEKRIPIQYPTFAGETLDYRTEYINSFQRQKQVIDMLREGYELGNEDVLDKLREIEEVYGK